MVGICSGTVDLLVLRTLGTSNVKYLKQFFSDQMVVQSWAPMGMLMTDSALCSSYSVTDSSGRSQGRGSQQWGLHQRGDSMVWDCCCACMLPATPSSVTSVCQPLCMPRDTHIHTHVRAHVHTHTHKCGGCLSAEMSRNKT